MDDPTAVTVADSSDEAPAFSAQETTPHQRVSSDQLTQIPGEPAFRPATLQERFAAFFTDTLLFLYLLGGWALALKYFTRGDLATPFSFRGTGRILFATTGLGLHFLYYFFFEGVLTATPGKLLGGLSIQKKSGETPSLFSILIRNLFRAIDYPLFFLTGVGLMEATKRRQRLGDLAARTVLVREISFEGRRIPPETCTPGGTLRRALAFGLDALLILPLLYGLLLLIPVTRPLVSQVALPLVPLAGLIAITLSESLFQTTPGKAAFGMKVIQEDGRPAPFSILMVRNFFRLVDLSPLGYLGIALSSRKQRLGDFFAGTLVVRGRRGLRDWLAIPFLLIPALTAAFFGYKNPDNFFRRDYVIPAGTIRFAPIPLFLKRLTLHHLYVEELNFGLTEEEANPKAVFGTGGTIYLLMRISGYSVKNEMAWIQADLQVTDPAGQTVLQQANIVNSSLPVGRRKSARLVTRFVLHPQATPGRYEATLTLRDLFGNTTAVEKRNFNVSP